MSAVGNFECKIPSSRVGKGSSSYVKHAAIIAIDVSLDASRKNDILLPGLAGGERTGAASSATYQGTDVYIGAVGIGANDGDTERIAGVGRAAAVIECIGRIR